jgi:hypothetical protein
MDIYEKIQQGMNEYQHHTGEYPTEVHVSLDTFCELMNLHFDVFNQLVEIRIHELRFAGLDIVIDKNVDTFSIC